MGNKSANIKLEKEKENEGKFSSSEEMEELLNVTWKDYIEFITEKGYINPKPVPSDECTNQHCGV
jgi:hypothetical protein